jgi:methanol metabolism-related c-type cytochrome
MTAANNIEVGKAFRAALLAKGPTVTPTLARNSRLRQGGWMVAGCLAGALALATFVSGMSVAWADGSGDPTVARDDDGKYYDKSGNPTFNIAPDGTVDWYTYSGYRRFNSECEVCHGFDGLGSTFAPSLVESLKTLSYSDFTSIVVGGRKDVNTANEKVMPSFGTDRNVMCYLDDIYVYLRARSDGKLGGGRPEKHVDKPAAAAKAEAACMGF